MNGETQPSLATNDSTSGVRDPERLAAVRRTGLLDSSPEEAFDRMTRLAAKIVGAPASFISLVDETRDFYKSCFGFSGTLAAERQMEGTTFCHYAIGADAPLAIPDTRADPVYRQVPTVESLGVAAYLGIPLVGSDGQAIGSFCVVDFEPREWSQEDVEIVTELAASTIREIELRMATHRAREEAEEARTARAAAEEAARAREEILAVVAHDLRNPLNAAFMSAGLLLDLLPAEGRERDRTQLRIIKRSTERMNRLIEDLLDIARIEAGHFSIQPEPVAPAAIVHEVVTTHGALAEDASVRLEAEVPDGLPAVRADRERLLQVFSNLVGNALKFTGEGGSVLLGAEVVDGEVRFSVSDTGPGISPEHLPHLFAPFWQAEKTDRRGAGLGLAISTGIVEAHGGKIWVESEPGRGSTFRFTVPRSA